MHRDLRASRAPRRESPHAPRGVRALTVGSARVVGLALGLAATLALAGCVAEPPAAPSGASGGAGASPSPSASDSAPIESLPVEPPDGVYAAGRIDDAPVSGAFRVVDAPVSPGVTTGLAIEFTELSGVPAGAEVRLISTQTVIESGCVQRNTLATGAFEAVAGQASVSFGRDLDPTMWRSFAIVTTGEGCPRILAQTALDWRVAPYRPRLASIIDGGPARGAMGEVSSVGGRVYAYRVASGDALSAIAGRFGIGPSDVRSLNPFTNFGESGDLLYAGDVLNLSLEGR